MGMSFHFPPPLSVFCLKIKKQATHNGSAACFFGNPAISMNIETRGFVPPGHPGFTFSETEKMLLNLCIVSTVPTRKGVTQVTEKGLLLFPTKKAGSGDQIGFLFRRH